MARGLSQVGLAELVGVTAAAVSSWERDQSFPRTATALKLARLFNTTVAWIRDGTGDAPVSPVEPPGKRRQPRMDSSLAQEPEAVTASSVASFMREYFERRN